MKKIAAINDLSGFGKCSLSAAITVVSALGVQCCPLATSVFSNQTGYDSFYYRDLTGDMRASINEWKKLGARFDGILTGFILNVEQGRIIGEFIDEFRSADTLVVVDPVMADDGALYKCYDNEMAECMTELTRKADIITPNLTELCIIGGREYERLSTCGDDETLSAVRDISAGLNLERPVTVVTSGIRLSDGSLANAVYAHGEFDVIRRRAEGGSFSGTGDILSAFVAAQSVKGVEIKKAVEQAACFIQKSIKETIRESAGRCDPREGVYFEKYLGVIDRLTEGDEK